MISPITSLPINISESASSARNKGGSKLHRELVFGSNLDPLGDRLVISRL